jgi:hypothetical protein
MTSTMVSQRERLLVERESPTRVDRALAHPVAFLLTALVLLGAFGATFVTNPGRPAPADDPAFYAWRTEALISDDPVTLLEVEGPQGALVGGYRVITPMIAGLMRRVAAVAPLTPTVFLAVGLRVILPLLLAGLAYRYVRDPLIFHSVAFGSASLLPSPPFGGYLDNVLTLTFLAASLFFLEPSRRSWPARLWLVALYTASGLAHPTTFVIFVGVLGAMALLRLLFRRFDLRSVLRDDGPALVSAGAASLVVYAVWKFGIWGQPAALGEAAVPPPANSAFFMKRMLGWLAALRPGLNGPLFALGVIGLLLTGRRALEDDFARPALVWLLPLVGSFGFLAGIAYPYYRFFNTTVSWLLLVGVGLYFAIRFLLAVAGRGGLARVALVGVVLLAYVVATNFTKGFEQVGWNDVEAAWISPAEIEEMDLVRANLPGDPDVPVVFVTDVANPAPERAYGWLKLVANVARYGVELGQQDRTFVYLGSVENFLAGEPSDGAAPNYRELSQASLDDAEAGIEAAGEQPVVVAAGVWNFEGVNSELVEGGEVPAVAGAELLVVSGDGVRTEQGASRPGDVVGGPAAGWLNLARTLAGLLLLLVPGFFAARAALPDAGTAELLGLVPALAMAALGLGGTVVLAIVAAPLSALLAWIILGLVAALLGVVLAARRGSPTAGGAAP